MSGRPLNSNREWMKLPTRVLRRRTLSPRFEPRPSVVHSSTWRALFGIDEAWNRRKDIAWATLSDEQFAPDAGL